MNPKNFSCRESTIRMCVRVCACACVCLITEKRNYHYYFISKKNGSRESKWLSNCKPGLASEGGGGVGMFYLLPMATAHLEEDQ